MARVMARVVGRVVARVVGDSSLVRTLTAAVPFLQRARFLLIYLLFQILNYYLDFLFTRKGLLIVGSLY